MWPYLVYGMDLTVKLVPPVLADVLGVGPDPYRSFSAASWSTGYSKRMGTTGIYRAQELALVSYSSEKLVIKC